MERVEQLYWKHVKPSIPSSHTMLGFSNCEDDAQIGLMTFLEPAYSYANYIQDDLIVFCECRVFRSSGNSSVIFREEHTA